MPGHSQWNTQSIPVSETVWAKNLCILFTYASWLTSTSIHICEKAIHICEPIGTYVIIINSSSIHICKYMSHM